MAPFSRRARSKRSQHQLQQQSFLDVSKSTDHGDSAVTIVENERQHGRMRAGTKQDRQSCARMSIRGYLGDWRLEHKSRNLGPLVESIPEERLRTIIRNHTAHVISHGRSRKCVGGNPKLIFVAARDAQDRIRLGRPRSVEEDSSNRKWLRALWDSLPSDDEAKVEAKIEFERQVRDRRLQAQPVPLAPPSDDQLKFEREPRSCFGLGCQAFPLSPCVLDDYRANWPQGGLRTLSAKATRSGFMSRIEGFTPRPDVDLKQTKNIYATRPSTTLPPALPRRLSHEGCVAFEANVQRARCIVAVG